MQSDSCVYGTEVEDSYSDAKYKYKLGSGIELRQRLGWNESVKVHEADGLARTMIYGIVGYSSAKFEHKGSVVFDSKLDSDDPLGAGVEQAFTNNVSAKV